LLWKNKPAASAPFASWRHDMNPFRNPSKLPSSVAGSIEPGQGRGGSVKLSKVD